MQKTLLPSPAHPFLFLAGMESAGYSCATTLLLEDYGSVGCWGQAGGFTGYQRAGKPTHCLVCLRSREAVLASQAGHFNNLLSRQRRGKACGGQDQWLPGGFLLELGRSWFNWRLQLLSEAKGEDPSEVLFLLFFSVTSLALFCPILSQIEMERSI